MNARALHFALIVLLVAPLTSRAASPEVYDFKPKDCQAYLKWEIDPDEVKDARAEHVVGWITANHPVLRALFDRDLPLPIKFDLFFMTSGYVLPPEKPKLFTPRAALEHYGRNISFFHYAYALDTDARARRHLRRSMNELLERDRTSFTAASLDFLAELISRSIFVLDALTDPHSQIGLSHDSNRAIHISTSSENYWFSSWRSMLSIEWPSCVPTESLRQLLEIKKFLNEEDVRARVVHSVSRRLTEIIETQQERCRRLQTCQSTSDFARILNEDVAASQLDFRKPIDTLTTPKLEPEREPTTSPPLFSPSEVIAFVSKHRSYHAANLAEAPLEEVWTDLRNATQLATQSLFTLEGWWADHADWPRLLAKLDPTVRSIASLRQRLDERGEKIVRALDQFTRAESAFEKLHQYAERANAMIRRFDLSDESVANLNRDSRQTLSAIVTNAPLVLALTADAVEAIARRRSVMKDQLSAIQNVNVLLGLVALARVKRPSASDDLSKEDEFLRLREALRVLAEASREAA